MKNKVRLDDVLKYEQPTKYIVESTNYDDSFKTPVLTAGKSFILGFTNESDGIYNDLPVIIFDDFTTASKYVDFPFKVKSSAMKILTADKKIADLKYLYYKMQNIDFAIKSHKRHWISKYSQIEITLPPLPQQKKIAAILSAADDLIHKDEDLLKKYDELLQALFLDMFGDPISNPKGWEIKKMKNISSKIHSGNTPKGGSDVYVEKGITFFRSQNVWKNRLEYDDIAYIDIATHRKMSKSSLKRGDILMTKTGRVNTENSSLGRAAIYLGNDDEANVNGHVYIIRLLKNINKEFVLYILTSKEYREHIRRVCVGGIDKRQLNKDHIEDFPIIFPPEKLQMKFIEYYKSIELQKSILQDSLKKTQELFNGLLQKAFTN